MTYEMKTYLVILKASDIMNYGQKGYSQKWESWSCEKLVAEHYDSRHKSEMAYYTEVTRKNVKSESGTGAILKFRKWQDEGLNEDYLL